MVRNLHKHFSLIFMFDNRNSRNSTATFHCTTPVSLIDEKASTLYGSYNRNMYRDSSSELPISFLSSGSRIKQLVGIRFGRGVPLWFHLFLCRCRCRVIVWWSSRSWISAVVIYLYLAVLFSGWEKRFDSRWSNFEICCWTNGQSF